VEDKYVRTHHAYSFNGKHQRRTQQQQQTQLSQQQLQQQYYQQQYFNQYHQQYHVPVGQYIDRYDKSLRWPAGARAGKWWPLSWPRRKSTGGNKNYLKKQHLDT